MFAVPPNTVAVDADRSLAHPVRIARELAVDRLSWAHRLRYDPQQRWAGLLERTATHEAWLLSWLPGQRTELHDHSGATGAFTVVSGNVTERVVRTAGAAPVEEWHTLETGQSRVFGPDYVHQVINDGPDPAITVHVYRPGRTQMTLYSLHPVEGLTRA
ncbi:cysteine dioxygenase family protein [Saccharopolyspora gloriosae]|uniref:cysteine dioxygenase n=1 Tax=Saccharopolyspora gloriosae TaxID=455344 RepID=UPI001FB79066|nr:cysteine dioxygenase family protein [Saccharopolyspora gloriosae]